MVDKAEQEASVSQVSMDGKKIRRGKRGNKKLNVTSVEEFLNSSMHKLEIQPKKRKPRMPKVSTQEPKNIVDGSVKTNKPKTITASPLLKQHGDLYEQIKVIASDVSQIPVTSPRTRKVNVEATVEKKFKKKTRKNTQGTNENDVNHGIKNLNINTFRNMRIDIKMKDVETSNNKCDKNKFPDYIPEKLIKKLLTTQRSENIDYVEGNIRINAKFHKEAYVAMPNNEIDILIDGIQDRNRALEGDLVVVKINPKEKWRGLNTPRPQKTGKVVCILDKIHPRKAVGFLKIMPNNPSQIALFSPKDHKVPRLNIDSSSWPQNFFNDPESFANTMFLAEITSWNDVRFALGKILTKVGETGDLTAESAAILLENDLDVTPYNEELTQNLPPSDYQPTNVDIIGREDWRKECIFTIDPSTATDLDDAMSCKPLDNGNFEVGVHISDVTHYLQAFSPLDIAVSKRATTIYLSNAVYHMLPKQLCNVCSLLPGCDKLAFSVIFEMTPEGEVVRHRFAKTIINSCCQFAYEHAQTMIINPDKEWSDDELPEIKGPYKISELCTVVNNLNNLAVKMREKRLNHGSLRIDQPKLHVFVDRDSGLPLSFTLEEQKDSNKLIEEFMLLANITTATHLYENLPDAALLRCHQPPLMHILTETQAMLEKLGIHIDIESAGALQTSLLRYKPDPEPSSQREIYLANCRNIVINALCAKPMTRAKYFCTSANMDADKLKHYALNVPFYTHFTSPIRRYSDCVVHRLLYASIQNALPVPNWTPKLCAKIAANCNKQKFNSKRAQEMSSELYLTYLLGLTGPVNTTAIAIDVKDRSVDVIICSMGINLRVYLAGMEKIFSIYHSRDDEIHTLKVVWRQLNITQVINVFSIMNVRVSKHPTTNRLQAELLPPEQLEF